jgi:hypothetical protein
VSSASAAGEWASLMWRRVDEDEQLEPVVDDAFDWVTIGTPHGGMWSRQDHGDELVCKEHALPVSGH